MPADPSAGSAAIAQDTQDPAQQVLARMDALKTGSVDPRFAKFSGSYLFDVEGVGIWKVIFDQGKKTVLDGGDAAECIVRSDAELFMKVAKGEQNLLTAFMQGRLVIEGDMALAQKLNSIMPAQTKGAASQGGAA